ncbi:integrase family protein (plasmid) [Gloeothece citriformis PCC 7424]|uniref:Integrase family protein n=1 Tax=Gloeothece citriformis (strain PCC 7424) TaxID=65393 RepID=B7KME9_GLOC7|nr:tyrosine-type recombinase/integrase [Gloeothece citriformis]ACK73971.1 integrase family protein [Gloeothece citriformis PCC 7424]
MTITLASLVTQFLERPQLSQNTIRSYESTLMPLLQQLGSVKVDLLTRQQLIEYLSGLTHLSYTTYNRHQAILQSLLNFAVEQGFLTSNPLSGLKSRKPDREKGEHSSDEPIRYLNPEQIAVLYRLLKENSYKPQIYRLQTLVTLLHRTGARIAEILALDLEEIDLKNRRFQVIGKGNKQRWCFYSDDVAKILEIYLKHYRYTEHSALFTAQQPLSKEVSRLSYRTAYRDWSNLIAKSPVLKGFRLHDLRHTFATERVGLMGIEELRALMGHENIQTTLRYQKVTSSRAEEVAQKALSILVNSEK